MSQNPRKHLGYSAQSSKLVRIFEEKPRHIVQSRRSLVQHSLQRIPLNSALGSDTTTQIATEFTYLARDPICVNSSAAVTAGRVSPATTVNLITLT
jgi:hypothetical protein